MSASVIYGILKNVTAVTDLVSTRIYPGKAEQFDVVPFIVFFKVGTDPSDTKNGVSTLDVIRVQLSLYGSDYDALETLAGLVRTNLDRYSGTVGSTEVQSIRFLNEHEGPEDPDTDHHHFIQEYSLRIKR